MNQMEELFGEYADNELTEPRSQALADLLRTSDAAVDWFVRESFLHWQLFAIARQRTLHAGVINSPDDVTYSEPLARGLSASNAGDALPNKPRWKRGAVLAVAASLALVAAALMWSNRPRVVGQLTQARADVRWATAADAYGVGNLLHAGREIRLERGRVLVTLVSGTQCIIEGPAVVRLTAENAISLKSGRIGAAVPPHATGFTVDVAAGRFVDLGTEFTLDVRRGRPVHLYVFDGLVDVQPVKGPAFKVPQSKAIAYDDATGVAKPLEFGDEQRLSL